MSFKVIKPGFLSTVQDYGRMSYGKYGLSQSGVMDEQAYCWANYLLDNHFNDAVIELAFGGLVLEAQVDTFVVLTGAESDFKINDEVVQMWRSVKVYQGDVLSIGNFKSGVYVYLAIKGGFDTPVLFDSRSINLREHIGAKLATSDIVPCKSHTEIVDRTMLEKYQPNYQKTLVLRLLPSYQFDDFDTRQQALFFKQSYRIDNASDRVGCRLNGMPIIGKQQIISEGMSYGSVEITPDGLPIILLKDAPSIGGYPKIGTVFSLDLAKLAQRSPKSRIKFTLIDINQAQQARKTFNTFFQIVI